MKNINFKVASFSSFRLLASYTNQITYRGEEVGELSGKQGGHDPIMVPFRVSRAEGQKKKSEAVAAMHGIRLIALNSVTSGAVSK